MRLHIDSLLGAVAALGTATAAAQAIADYSHAQRALIEAGMAQAAARVAALGASSVGPAASAASVASLPASPTPAMRQAEPEIVVAGVYDSDARTLAEIHVDGHPYLLSSGQPVPGTAWHVSRIAIDRVVLARADGNAAVRHAASGTTTRTFELPAWR